MTLSEMTFSRTAFLKMTIMAIIRMVLGRVTLREIKFSGSAFLKNDNNQNGIRQNDAKEN